METLFNMRLIKEMASPIPTGNTFESSLAVVFDS